MAGRQYPLKGLNSQKHPETAKIHVVPTNFGSCSMKMDAIIIGRVLKRASNNFDTYIAELMGDIIKLIIPCILGNLIFFLQKEHHKMSLTLITK